MKRFRKILVYGGPDGLHDPALRRAVELAKSSNGAIGLVTVVEHLSPYARLVTPASWDVPGLIAGEHAKRLSDIADSICGEGVDITSEVLVGKPAAEITRHVIENNYDLVLKTARPDDSKHRMFFGTLASRLMRMCPCPVWILQPAKTAWDNRIVAAIDPNENDEESAALNTKIVEMAIGLAEREDAELDIIHAWPTYGVSLLQKRLPRDELAAYVAECEAKARAAVDTFLSTFDLAANTTVRLLRGEARDVIPQFVSDSNAKLLVVGTVCRAGLNGLLIGNTAERVLPQIGCSILTVKPDGFHVPVSFESRGEFLAANS